VISVVTVPAANHSAATRSPSVPRTSRSNTTAAATALSAPTSRGPSTEASGGKSTL
jgi:hypothetical protein